jgi:hypothetical protein
MLKKLFRKKNINSKSDEKLNRCLTSFDLTLLGIGCIIGTGIFVLTGIAAANQAGPAVILSFLASGFACAFAALSYAELSSSVGGCGSAYGYAYVAFGEFIAWIVGWILLMEYGMALAAVANGWSGYFNNALIAMGIGLPDALTKPPSLGGIINLPASLIILMIMVLLIIGVKESARFNKVMVTIKVSAILIFIAFAMFNVNPENWSPFMPFGWFETLPSGKTVGVLAGASIVFFAYVGFDAVSTAAEEAINPQRDLPKGIINSLIFCTIIYIIVAALLTGVVPYQELNVSSPVAFALAKIGFPWASALVSIGVPSTIGFKLGSRLAKKALQARKTGTSFSVGSRNAVKQAYEMASVGPEDLDLVELHDCFALAEMLHYGNLGLCKDEDAGKYVDDGYFEMGGKLPVNLSGGLLAKGHPTGATGVANLYEICTHLRGEAGQRQVKDANIGMAHVIGLGSACGIHILEKA